MNEDMWTKARELVSREERAFKLLHLLESGKLKALLVESMRALAVHGEDVVATSARTMIDRILSEIEEDSE